MYINIRFKYFQMHIYRKFEYTKMYRMHTMKFVINTFVYYYIVKSIKYILHECIYFWSNTIVGRVVKEVKTRKKLEFSSQRFDKVGMKWLVFGTWNTRFSSARRGIKMLRYSFLLFIPLRERERERCREMPAIEFQFLTNSSTLL